MAGASCSAQTSMLKLAALTLMRQRTLRRSRMRKLLLSFCLIFSPAALFAESLLPTAIGTTWEYEIKDASASSHMLVRVAGSDEVDGQQLLRLETLIDDQVTQRDFISVDERGVLCYRRSFADGATTSFLPPQIVFPAAAKIGAKWDTDDATPNGQVHRQFVIVAEEKVAVPAGSFTAFHLQCDQPWPVSTVLERWFVPSVGMVKEVATTRGPNGRLINRLVAMLAKFSPGTAPIAQQTPALRPSAEITAESGTPTPSPTPAAPKVKVELASSRDGAATAEFRADTANIFVRWAGENLPLNATVRLAWIAEDVGDVVDPNFVIDEVKRTISAPESGGRFTLSRPRDGWAPGKYRIELYLNDELMETVRCTIHE